GAVRAGALRMPSSGRAARNRPDARRARRGAMGDGRRAGADERRDSVSGRDAAARNARLPEVRRCGCYKKIGSPHFREIPRVGTTTLKREAPEVVEREVD